METPCRRQSGQAVHFDVGHAGIFALRLPGRPAHDFDTGKTLRCGEGENLLEIQFGKDGGDEAEFHGGVSCTTIKRIHAS
jgi:hypothetical protein